MRFLFLEVERLRKTSYETTKEATLSPVTPPPPTHPPRACEAANHTALMDGRTDGRTAGCSSSAPCTPSPQLASEKNALLLFTHAGTDDFSGFLVEFGGVGGGLGGGGVVWQREGRGAAVGVQLCGQMSKLTQRLRRLTG